MTSTDERREFWERIASSEAWREFWLSEDVVALESKITGSILSMNTTDPNQISYERGRLAMLQTLRKMTSSLLQVENDMARLRAEQHDTEIQEALNLHGRRERPFWQKVMDHLPRPTN